MKRPSLLATALLAALPSPAAAQSAPSIPIPKDTVVETTASGLRYCVLQPGRGGPHPVIKSHVLVQYTGWLTDGTVIDSSALRKKPFEFQVGDKQILPGWSEAVQLMTRGEVLKMTLPPKLAYGEKGLPPAVPPGSSVVFAMELVDFQELPALPEGHPDAQTTTSSGLVWEVLEPGEGPAPRAGQFAQIQYAYWNPNGVLVDCSRLSERNLEGPVGAIPQPLAFLQEAPQLMRVGGRYRFEVPPELAFGARARPGLPPNSRTVWELEVLKALDPLPLPPFERSAPERLQHTPSGLGYEVLRLGSGRSPQPGERVLLQYVGWLEDGKVFKSSYERGEAQEFPVGRVFPGWDEGVQMMKPGAIYRFEVPPGLAYGKDGTKGIPPNATLILRIELVSIVGAK